MGFRENMRNLFYLIFHTDEILAKQEKMANSLRSLEFENSQLKEQQASQQAAAKEYREHMQGILLNFLPPELNAAEVQKLYDITRSLDRTGILSNEKITARSRFGFLSDLGEKCSEELTRIQYTNALVKMGVLPKENAVYALSTEFVNLVAESVGAVGLPEEMPLGRIDYLSPRGAVMESLWFRDPAAFLERIYDDNFSGVPMSICVYSDPETGRHMDTFWAKDMDPAPQGYCCVPFDPIAELVSQFTKEQLSMELKLRQMEAEDQPVGRIDMSKYPPVPELFSNQQIRQAIGKIERDAYTFHSIEECKISKLMTKLSSNAWRDVQPQELYIHAGEDVIRLRGYIYEPGFEFFSSTSSIALNGKTLYGKDSRSIAAYRNETYDTGLYTSLEDAIGHIKEHVQAKDFVISEQEVLPSLEELYFAGLKSEGKQSLDQLVRNAEGKRLFSCGGDGRTTSGPER